MNPHEHEQIQRYLNGQAGAEETAELQTALAGDAGLRALYLDYMNLDVALGAAADAASLTNAGPATASQPAGPSAAPHYWRWAAMAAAACVAFILMMTLPGRRHAARTGPDVAAACSAAQEAITRLAVKPPPALPEWTSPTAVLLEQPSISKGDQSS